jgi:hypothetical protein
MVTLGTAIAESVLYHYGRSALLARLSDPFWFQALGSVMGMDWHSSGITTSVMGALKRGLNPRSGELGVFVCGGRGRQSRHTPRELRDIAQRTDLDGEALVRTNPRKGQLELFDRELVKGSALDIPAQPSTSLLCLLARFARLARYAVRQRVRNSRSSPHNGLTHTHK